MSPTRPINRFMGWPCSSTSTINKSHSGFGHHNSETNGHVTRHIKNKKGKKGREQLVLVRSKKIYLITKHQEMVGVIFNLVLRMGHETDWGL